MAGLPSVSDAINKGLGALGLGEPDPNSEDKWFVDSSHDTLVLGSWQFPGVVTSFIPTVTYDYSVNKSKDQNFANIEFHGMFPRVIDVDILIWNAAHYKELTTKILKDINAQATSKETKLLAIGHPMATNFGITHVYITDIMPGQPDPVSGWTISLRLLEHRDPVKAKSSKSPIKKKSALSSEDPTLGSLDKLDIPGNPAG